MITAQDAHDWNKEAVRAENAKQQAAIREFLEGAGLKVDTLDFDMGLQIGVMWRVSDDPPRHKAKRFPLGTLPAEILAAITGDA